MIRGVDRSAFNIKRTESDNIWEDLEILIKIVFYFYFINNIAVANLFFNYKELALANLALRLKDATTIFYSIYLADLFFINYFFLKNENIKLLLLLSLLLILYIRVLALLIILILVTLRDISFLKKASI